MTKKRKSLTPLKAPNIIAEQPSSNCYQGDCLNDLLQKLGRSIEEAKQLKGQLPDKIWNKQQFAIGVNDVTRVLERMPRGEACVGPVKEDVSSIASRAPLVPLQAVLLASDVNPRMLTKHVPSLASSRKVPVIFIKDNKEGSLRLGEVVKLKTAMAIGVKVRGSVINKAIEEILCGSSPVVDDTLEMDQGGSILAQVNYEVTTEKIENGC